MLDIKKINKSYKNKKNSSDLDLPNSQSHSRNKPLQTYEMVASLPKEFDVIQLTDLLVNTLFYVA